MIPQPSSEAQLKPGISVLETSSLAYLRLENAYLLAEDLRILKTPGLNNQLEVCVSSHTSKQSP